VNINHQSIKQKERKLEKILSVIICE